MFRLWQSNGHAFHRMAADTYINTGERKKKKTKQTTYGCEYGLCKKAAGQNVRQGSLSLCQKYQWLNQCRQRQPDLAAMSSQIQTFVVIARCPNQSKSLGNTLCSNEY